MVNRRQGPGAAGTDDRVVLLTGFGPFPGVPTNPTATVARSLHGARIAGHRVVGVVLEVGFASVAQAVPRLIARHGPVAVVHLGVAERAAELRVERLAWNEARAAKPDTAGRIAQGEALTAAVQAQASVQTTVDVDGLVAALRAAGYPTQASDDAGRYVCNAAYLAGLLATGHGARPSAGAGHDLRGDAAAPCVFVHMPAVSVERWRPLVLERSAIIAVHALAKAAAARRQPAVGGA